MEHVSTCNLPAERRLAVKAAMVQFTIVPQPEQKGVLAVWQYTGSADAACVINSAYLDRLFESLCTCKCITFV